MWLYVSDAAELFSLMRVEQYTSLFILLIHYS